MPDNQDYQYLGWVYGHPEKWSEHDLANVRHMIANQKRAIRELHPMDVRGRRSMQEVVDRLEDALRSHLAGRG